MYEKKNAYVRRERNNAGFEKRDNRRFDREERVKAPVEPAELPENMLYGRNPVMEALKSGRDIEKIVIARGEINGSINEIMARAKKAHITIQETDRDNLNAFGVAHQGVVAYVSCAKYYTVDEILESAREKGESPFVVVLDGITDPQNVGAIARSAECAGAHGIIFSSRRQAGLTPAATKTAAGAFEYIKAARVTNIPRTLDELKEEGLWIFGAAMDGVDYRKTNFDGPVALVIGSEGDGISRLVLEKCDHIVSLPLYGKIQSLNASCAAAVLLYQIAAGRHEA